MYEGSFPNRFSSRFSDGGIPETNTSKINVTMGDAKERIVSNEERPCREMYQAPNQRRISPK
jgi:hypothetical protein